MKAGEEIFVDYGSLSTRELLLHHGFLPDKVPDDSLLVVVKSHWNTSSGYDTLLKRHPGLSEYTRVQVILDFNLLG